MPALKKTRSKSFSGGSLTNIFKPDEGQDIIDPSLATTIYLHPLKKSKRKYLRVNSQQRLDSY